MLQTKCLLDRRAASHLPDVHISVTFSHGNTRLMQQLTRWEYKQRLSFSFELRLLSNKFGLYSSTECNTVNAFKERLFGEDQLQAKKLFDNQAG